MSSLNRIFYPSLKSFRYSHSTNYKQNLHLSSLNRIFDSAKDTFARNLNFLEENKIVIYQSEDGQTQIDVRLENETVWLTQAQMVELFQTTKQNVSLHVNNVFKEGELEQQSTVKEYLTVQQEGQRTVSRQVKYYNLDVIISVGYRVKSKRGTAFRIWANRILKEYPKLRISFWEALNH